MSRTPSYPEDEEQELLPSTPLSVVESSTPANEINLKVQHVQEQLLDLKRQQEEIERQKRDLEDLSRKQREFDEGRREIVEKLTRGLVLLERQNFETQRELEQIKLVHDSFVAQLSQTEGLNPSNWSTEELPGELTRALAHIDQAKAVYSQSRARLTALREADEEHDEGLSGDLNGEAAPYEKSFGAMVREGFAYALPAILFGIFALLALFLLRK